MRIPTVELTSSISIGGGARPLYIAGPCVIESLEQCLNVAGRLAEIAARLGLPLLFKASFDKANRSSVSSFRGPGLHAGLEILSRIKSETGLPLVTDVHQPEQAAVAAEVVDVLQVPAFLCRQTDLLVACGETGLPVNIKKGQFLAAEDMGNAVEKVASTGNNRITLTERGSTFGYHNLVVDMRGLPLMRLVAPVIFDVTHSLQLPGGLGHATAGAREFHPYLARAAAAAGVDGFFIEVHSDPENALSDATTQLSINEFVNLVPQLEAVSRAVGEFV
ncbi:MAG: 3-deoxy-8-phosphooctulonate synthase [Acidobacteria bacterium]|nr:MAG: 3-deoxy-8-phosphooctulonate synthase [Acidobacteriota bacterium]RLE34264.1 MAG: 3-deoxy-8-phosphooctulonate synthase [Acidobacteriota bacterium]